jgi:hypothetical protein
MILSAKKTGFQLNSSISNWLKFHRVKSDEVELDIPPQVAGGHDRATPMSRLAGFQGIEWFASDVLEHKAMPA